MRPKKMLLPLAALACLTAGACNPGVRGSSAAAAETTAAARAPLLGTEWALVELGGRVPPPGDAARPATLLLSEGRASGFAGCNGFSGGYTLGDGTALRFGALASTRMACAAGMELERDYSAALEATRGYRLTAQGLELRGAAGVVARFTPLAAARR